ncbi:MAG TPA: APC family permease [Solirubrobacteraceae bacterium]|jgi:amino acid transporter|nr:APC family permease [Solirubrobacteraceae bacterium]
MASADTSLRERGTQASGQGRLARGVLSDVDIAAATVADMAPAMSFFFGFATIVTAAGIAAPLTVIVAAIAIGLLGNTLSQFSRSRPSTGSFVTFIGSAFGGYSAVVMAVVLCTGYIIAVAAVVAISGGLAETILKHYLSITIPWQAISAVLVLGALALIVSGAKPSTKVAAALFVFQVLLLLAVAISLLVEHSRHINLSPLDPSRLHRGFSGLALGFPLAVYLFVGWENSAALAEEHHDPRRGVTRAVFSSILVVGVLYVFLTYATVVGFNENAGALAKAQIPFITAAGSVASGLALIAYIAGFTSICSCLISATNAQARIIFNSGREGLLPSVTARLTERSRTPWAAFSLYLALALGLTYVFGWNTDPVTFFGEIATLGTILIALIYLVANLALPVYYHRYEPDLFSPVKHVLLPLLGAVAIGYPLYELVKPGQPAPFDRYPLIAAGVVVVALIWGGIAFARDRSLGERVGSIVADAD